MKPEFNDTQPRRWTQQETDYLVEHYARGDNQVIANHLGRSRLSVQQRAAKIGLRKNTDILLQQRMKNQFKAGMVPWNKGKPMRHAAKFIEMQFKRGFLPTNFRPQGSVRVTEDHYIQVKGAGKTEWLSLRRELWKLYHQTDIPDGAVIKSKDGNPYNLAPDNLILATRSTLMMINSMQNLPGPIREVMKLKGQLSRQINRKINGTK